jgi:hypothetical protein
MQEVGLAAIMAWFADLLHVGNLSNTAVLFIGVVVGLIAKNIYTIAMRTFGFAGGYFSRLAIGWWEEVRRETPNVIDFGLAVVAECEGRATLHMDPLLGPRRLTDVYLNPRTAFGVRMQTFSVTPDEPWIAFKLDRRHGLIRRLRYWWWARLHGRPAKRLSPRGRLILRYRRVYAPIENLISQYLTNQWAIQMAIGEPCHVFRFVIALVYETSTDPHSDRHFHALVIWEDLLLRDDLPQMVSFLPENNRRIGTILKIADRYKSSPEAAQTFGYLNVMIPKRILQHVYFVAWTTNIDGDVVPVSRPVADDPDAKVATALGRLPPGIARQTNVPSDDVSPLD